MRQVTIHEAKTHLSRLLMEVEQGREVVVARASRPIARIVPYVEDGAERQPARRRSFGIDTSGWRVPDDFNAPLPEDVLKSFE